MIVKKPFRFFNSAYHSINEFVKFDADEFNNLLRTKTTKKHDSDKKRKIYHKRISFLLWHSDRDSRSDQAPGNN